MVRLGESFDLLITLLGEFSVYFSSFLCNSLFLVHSLPTFSIEGSHNFDCAFVLCLHAFLVSSLFERASLFFAYLKLSKIYFILLFNFYLIKPSFLNVAKSFSFLLQYPSLNRVFPTFLVLKSFLSTLAIFRPSFI